MSAGFRDLDHSLGHDCSLGFCAFSSQIRPVQAKSLRHHVYHLSHTQLTRADAHRQAQKDSQHKIVEAAAASVSESEAYLTFLLPSISTHLLKSCNLRDASSTGSLCRNTRVHRQEHSSLEDLSPRCCYPSPRSSTYVEQSRYAKAKTRKTARAKPRASSHIRMDGVGKGVIWTKHSHTSFAGSLLWLPMRDYDLWYKM
jgi:hypothetical protein